MKFRIVVFLSVVLTALLLAGCGDEASRTVISQNGR